ncbi:MAG: dethiobiotin synthase, partial [Planctomycetaceae bacterium]
VGPQMFRAPLAPPVAAQHENRSVDDQLLTDGFEWWQERVELLLVEGVGGLLCPLTSTRTIADFAEWVGFPVLIVATMELGTINHTLLTVEVAQQRGLDVRGILMNQSHPSQDVSADNQNPNEIARRCDVPVLGVVKWKSQAELLCPPGTGTMDLLSLAGERNVRSR